MSACGAMSCWERAAEMGEGNCSKLELEKAIEVMEKDVEELQASDRENRNSIDKLIQEYDTFIQSYIEEHEKLFRNAEKEVKKMSNDKRALENLRKFTEDQKKRKENLQGKMLKLGKEIKQGELELKERGRTLDVMKLKKDGGDIKTLMEIYDLEDQGEYLEELNQILEVKERKARGELEEARKVLIEEFFTLPYDSEIDVKTIGGLDFMVFFEEVKKKHSCDDEDACGDIAVEIFSAWEDYLADPDWRPLKVVNVDGKHKEIIDEDDEKLKKLKNDYDEEVCKAVTTALRERMEYNPIQRRPIIDLWNYKQNRIATVAEGVARLLELKLGNDDERAEEF